MEREHGHTLLETLVVLALSGSLAGLALPALSGLLERARMRGASRELTTELREARSRAIAENRTLGLVFERDTGGWRHTLYADGDGDGIRTVDLAAGTDVPLASPRRLGDGWRGVDMGFLDLPRIRKLPPSTSWLTSRDDPVQFGATDIVSFSPQGDASSGTLYVSDARSQMVAITLFGPTARVRSYRYDTAQEVWVP